MTAEALRELIEIGAIVLFGGGGITALIVALLAHKRATREADITERKNEDDADAALVERYRSMADEERAAKESAVKTVRELLALAQEQIDGLKATIERLTATIEAMSHASTVQHDVVVAITNERNLLTRRAETAEAEVARLRLQLDAAESALAGAPLAPTLPDTGIMSS